MPPALGLVVSLHPGACSLLTVETPLSAHFQQSRTSVVVIVEMKARELIER